MNKEIRTLMRELRKQGAVIRPRGNGGSSFNVDGPNGRYILHATPSAGMHMGITRKALRRIGFDV
jgi:hypothetical protein